MNYPLDKYTLEQTCCELSKQDDQLAFIHQTYGTPPLWDRPQGFASLLQIILEQQVSLASAKACFDKLALRLGGVTPESLLTLDDAELKTAGFSRQKTSYARYLAESILVDRINLNKLSLLPDAEVKAELIKLKGVGEWTSDIYLLMALLRPDVMPKGDIALHAAWQKLTGSQQRPGSDEFIEMAVKWSPHRSTVARLLWHFYLLRKGNTYLDIDSTP
ncbi:MAG: hypothetical protein WKF92_07690 [Pyrinomonadaceae bacterium]